MFIKWNAPIRKNPALQDSPPAAGRYKRHLPFRRSAILPGRAFYAIGNSNGISYSIKKALILQKDESCQHSLYHLLHCTGLHTQPIHAPCNGGIPLSPTCSFRDKTPEWSSAESTCGGLTPSPSRWKDCCCLCLHNLKRSKSAYCLHHSL